jgi:hypothetical protein
MEEVLEGVDGAAGVQVYEYVGARVQRVVSVRACGCTVSGGVGCMVLWVGRYAGL